MDKAKEVTRNEKINHTVINPVGIDCPLPDNGSGDGNTNLCPGIFKRGRDQPFNPDLCVDIRCNWGRNINDQHNYIKSR
jgi:hypothetical protein